MVTSPCYILTINIIKNIFLYLYIYVVNGFLVLCSYGKELFRICVRSHEVLHVKAKSFFFLYFRWHELLHFVYCCLCVNLCMWVYKQAGFAVLVSIHILSVCIEFFCKDQGSHISLSGKIVLCTSHCFIQCWGFQAMLLNPSR